MSDRQPGLTEDMLFLAKMAADVIEASRVAPGQAVGGEGPNSTGQTLIRPGGRDCYPGFWIRDFTMSLACGLVPRDEIEHAVRLTAGGQASEDWHRLAWQYPACADKSRFQQNHGVGEDGQQWFHQESLSERCLLEHPDGVGLLRRGRGG